MAARKKTGSRAAAPELKPRGPESPEAILRSALGSIIETDLEEQKFVSAQAVRGSTTHFSGGQQGERSTVQFTYEYPEYVAVKHEAVVDLQRLPAAMARHHDYEGQEAAIEALFMRPDFTGRVLKIVEAAVLEGLKYDQAHHTPLKDEDSDEIYDVISAASNTRYTAYNRAGEEEKRAEYPSVYIRWDLTPVSSKLLAIKPAPNSIVVTKQTVWRAEPKRWSFDPEDLWPRRRMLGRSTGSTSSFIVAVLNTVEYPNRKVYTCGDKNSTFYSPEFGAFFTLFQKKAQRFRSRQKAEKWLALRPRARGQIYVET